MTTPAAPVAGLHRQTLAALLHFPLIWIGGIVVTVAAVLGMVILTLLPRICNSVP